ncbi:MAG: MCE family protein [Bdellovibrionaceae bacterium]|nr:MCE family protein [Pseudobdellovibrionaceae bacterium]MBX3033043.1 MCE family protein [Pseudobdellovibrionaceae bacterium]
MEATLKTQFKVGVFLLITIFLVLLSIFMIGGEGSFFRNYVQLHAHFTEVQGLAEGSVVSLSGVSVGNIEKIEFVSEINKLDVVMRVDTRFLPRIRQGTQVEIRTQGALGDKFIFLIPADPKNPPVRAGEVLDVARATDLFSIVSERGKDTERFFDILNEVHRMTKTVNDQGRLEKIMINMAATSGALRDVALSAQKFSAAMGEDSATKLRQSIDKLESVISKIDRGQGTLGALINDASVHEQLKEILGGSSRKQHMKSMIRTSIEKAESK